MLKQKNTKNTEESIGAKIDLLIRSNLKNWEGKENFYNRNTPFALSNKGMIEMFQANKMRNLMITQINKIVHDGPAFHFRNYHNY